MIDRRALICCKTHHSERIINKCLSEYEPNHFYIGIIMFSINISLNETIFGRNLYLLVKDGCDYFCYKLVKWFFIFTWI
jgi:hypothetical protein